MTPEQEIERIKRDFAEHWMQFEKHPCVKQAIDSRDPIKLAEWLCKLVHGDKLPSIASNPLDAPPRKIVSVNKLNPNWMDQVYLEFHRGHQVDLENFICPDDERMCKDFAQRLGARDMMNPAKTKFFFRHS
jgi:hypothetical protein